MNSKRFNHLLGVEVDRIYDTLAEKSSEYSTVDNKLHNFDKAGKMANTTRERALLGFLLKHQVSIDDIVDKLDKELPSLDLVSEKITDILNYYILLKACIVDRIEKGEISGKE